MRRRGVVSLALLIGLTVAALIAGVVAQKTFDPRQQQTANSLQQAGAQVGGMIAGPPGAAIGGSLGYLLALVFGVAAADRHAKAAAATAQLNVVRSPVTPTPAK